MTAPARVQLSRRKGWRMPPNTVKVDRTTKWGNPFIIGQHGTRAKCALWYRYLAGGGLLCLGYGNIDAQKATAELVRSPALEELRGKNLACWCPQGADCHADVLLEVANGG